MEMVRKGEWERVSEGVVNRWQGRRKEGKEESYR